MGATFAGEHPTISREADSGGAYVGKNYSLTHQQKYVVWYGKRDCDGWWMCFGSWVRCRTSESHLHTYKLQTHTGQASCNPHHSDMHLSSQQIPKETCPLFSTSFFFIANSKLLKPLGGLIPSCGWWISSSSQNGSGHAVGAMLLGIWRLMGKTGWCTYAWHLFFGLLKKPWKIDRNRIVWTFQPWFIDLKTQQQNATKIWKPYDVNPVLNVFCFGFACCATLLPYFDTRWFPSSTRFYASSWEVDSG